MSEDGTFTQELDSGLSPDPGIRQIQLDAEEKIKQLTGEALSTLVELGMTLRSVRECIGAKGPGGQYKAWLARNNIRYMNAYRAVLCYEKVTELNLSVDDVKNIDMTANALIRLSPVKVPIEALREAIKLPYHVTDTDASRILAKHTPKRKKPKPKRLVKPDYNPKDEFAELDLANPCENCGCCWWVGQEKEGDYLCDNCRRPYTKSDDQSRKGEAKERLNGIAMTLEQSVVHIQGLFDSNLLAEKWQRQAVLNNINTAVIQLRNWADEI